MQRDKTLNLSNVCARFLTVCLQGMDPKATSRVNLMPLVTRGSAKSWDTSGLIICQKERFSRETNMREEIELLGKLSVRKAIRPDEMLGQVLKDVGNKRVDRSVM